MNVFLLVFMMMAHATDSELGRVVQTSEGSYLVRNSQKTPLVPELSLELGDDVFSGRGTTLIHIYPGAQVALSPGSGIKISENSMLESKETLVTHNVIDFLKGIIRVLVTKDVDQEINQRIRTESVSFGVRGTEFDISFGNDQDVELDVLQGVVEASSPYVQSFVPEIIKTGEGLRFSRSKKSFGKRPFIARFKQSPTFLTRADLRKKWKEVQELRSRKKKFAKKKGFRKHIPKK